MKKGIVIEINDRILTLLTPDGQFLQARRQEHPYIIGEEILFTPISKKKTAFLTRYIGIKHLSIAAAALFLFCGSFIPVYQSNKAYAYMSIDVNPSLELGINKQMQVIKLTAFNKDGEKIITHIKDWKKKDVSDIAQVVLKEMKKEGYLNKKHSMVISTVRTEKTEEKTEEQLSKNMGEIKEMAKENNLKVTVITGTEKEMEEAHQLGLTTGKYKETKIQSVKKKTNPLPVQKQATENSGGAALSGDSTQSVNQEDPQTAKPEPPGINKSEKDQEQNPAIENRTPPGQLKKDVEAQKEQQKQYKSEPKNQDQDHEEKKSLPIIKNQHQWHSEKQNYEKDMHKEKE